MKDIKTYKTTLEWEVFQQLEQDGIYQAYMDGLVADTHTHTFCTIHSNKDYTRLYFHFRGNSNPADNGYMAITMTDPDKVERALHVALMLQLLKREGGSKYKGMKMLPVGRIE